MNVFMKQHGEMYHETQVMREQLMDMLTDADLAFSPGGSNPTLGALCKEMGDVEHAYINSFKTMKHERYLVKTLEVIICKFCYNGKHAPVAQLDRAEDF